MLVFITLLFSLWYLEEYWCDILPSPKGTCKIRGYHVRLVLFFSALLVTLWDFVMVQRITFPLSLIKVAGLSLFLAGVSIRVVAVRTLGKYFSPELRTLKDHRLVNYGLYKYIRHPAYLGSFLFSIGIPLIFSGFYGFLLMLALFPCFLYTWRFPRSSCGG